MVAKTRRKDPTGTQLRKRFDCSVLCVSRLSSYLNQVFRQALEQISRQIYREEDFIADFLQINEAGLTFADYMELDNYFRRQAARMSGLSAQTNKLVRGAMDLIFGFLPLEMKSWIDQALAKDSMSVFLLISLSRSPHNLSCYRHIIGIMATLERFLADAEERGKAFFINFLDKQHTRLKGLFERHVVSDSVSMSGDVNRMWLCRRSRSRQ